MAFGATDRVPCPECNGEMIVVWRQLSHKDRRFERQILECTSCSNKDQRTINTRGEIFEDGQPI